MKVFFKKVSSVRLCNIFSNTWSIKISTFKNKRKQFDQYMLQQFTLNLSLIKTFENMTEAIENFQQCLGYKTSVGSTIYTRQFCPFSFQAPIFMRFLSTHYHPFCHFHEQIHNATYTFMKCTKFVMYGFPTKYVVSFHVFKNQKPDL